MKYLRVFFLFSILLSFCLVFLESFDLAEATKEVSPLQINAEVGEFYLSVSGYVSPYASVVLLSDGIFYRAGVADSFGNFSISQVLIREGFSHFCLQAVDFRRLGTSESCFNVSPAETDIIMNNLFLPPTIGLQRTEIVEGGEAIVFGYTMPGAQVVIHLNNSTSFSLKADKNGYYEYHMKNVKAGYYTLFADATYKGKPSAKPAQTISLSALSEFRQAQRLAVSFWRTILPYLLNPLFWCFPLLLLIGYLAFRIWPEKFAMFLRNPLFVFLFRREDKSDHGEDKIR